MSTLTTVKLWGWGGDGHSVHGDRGKWGSVCPRADVYYEEVL